MLAINVYPLVCNVADPWSRKKCWDYATDHHVANGETLKRCGGLSPERTGQGGSMASTVVQRSIRECNGHTRDYNTANQLPLTSKERQRVHKHRAGVRTAGMEDRIARS